MISSNYEIREIMGTTDYMRKFMDAKLGDYFANFLFRII